MTMRDDVDEEERGIRKIIVEKRLASTRRK